MVLDPFLPIPQHVSPHPRLHFFPSFLHALQVLKEAGSENDQKYATKIIPVRSNGNLLICTLLLGNTIVNNSLSVLLADLTTGAVGIVSSVFLVLIFGELIPQAMDSLRATVSSSAPI
jgi:Mg2+/Co2+ transporter CorB